MRRVVRVIFLFVACMLPLVADAQQSKNAIEQLQKLNSFYRHLSVMYVDSLDMKPIVERGIREMLSELDPHSTYLDAEEMKASQEADKGEFSGIGIQYNIHNDSIVVVRVLPNGPSERAGLLPNDRIVDIDGESVVGIKQNDVSPKLRGPRGSEVKIGVVRRGVEQVLPFTIVRDDIPINTIDAAYVAAEGVGYIKVNRFGKTTMREFRQAMDSLSGVDALILDLSGNGGGLLNQAVDLAGYFLPQDSKVVSIEGRAMSTEILRSAKGGEFDGSMVVIIDENSASGSELVAGALQDWDRAVIVGRDSYGKGLVQRQIPMGDGSAIRLTVARYHTPSGRVIQRPYEKGHKEDYYKAHTARLQGAKSDSVKQSKIYNTLRSRREVYGGGGIRPDVYVKSDTTQVSNYMVKLVAQGVYTEFMTDYMDKNRQQLESKYPTYEVFEQNFELSDDDIVRLADLATQKGVEYDAEGFECSKSLMRNQLTAMVAQRLYGDNEFYKWINPRVNDSYNKAMEIIRNWDEQGVSLLNP